MRDHDGLRIWIALLMTTVLICCTGCPPPRQVLEPVVDDVPMDKVIARVNRNVSEMDFLLKASPLTATGKVRHPATERFESFDTNGTLYFQKPRCLLARLSHPLAGSIELGSNDAEFWYWEKVDKPRYIYGMHEEAETAEAEELPLRPDYLVEILGLNELPVATSGPAGPLFEVRSERYVLTFLGRDAANRLYYTKSIFVDRRPPYLVRLILYYDGEGHKLIQATLDDYKTIEGSSVLAPHRILIEQKKTSSHVELRFVRMQRSDNRKVEAYIERSPLDRGKVEWEWCRRVTRLRSDSSWPATFPAGEPALR